MSAPISPIRMITVPPAPPVDPAGQSASAGGFHSMLQNMIGGVEQSQTQAQQSVDNFLSGGNEELHSVALATQRASLEFDLFLQVRNKAVAAYQQIMQMQV
jgi:flagellar hook-basal body complex protein FliE